MTSYRGVLQPLSYGFFICSLLLMLGVTVLDMSKNQRGTARVFKCVLDGIVWYCTLTRNVHCCELLLRQLQMCMQFYRYRTDRQTDGQADRLISYTDFQKSVEMTFHNKTSVLLIMMSLSHKRSNCRRKDDGLCSRGQKEAAKTNVSRRRPYEKTQTSSPSRR